MSGDRRKKFDRRKRKLQEATGPSGQRFGISVTEYIVGDWCDSPDGSGDPYAVGIQIMTDVPDVSFVLRLKSRASVDEMIEALDRHKLSVFGSG